MRKSSNIILSCILVFTILGLTGCAKESDTISDNQQIEMPLSEDAPQMEESSAEDVLQEEVIKIAESPADEAQEVMVEPVMEDVDLSAYFDGINGAAVIYDPIENCYQIYHQELACTRRSPCSTFKIISSLIALENGIIKTDDSTHTWSGEIFWNEAWNRDIDFPEAFRASCVWYFREIIDEIGKDTMQEKLDELSYGNCDISDWEGRLNTNNNTPALTGFWIESSLLISPKEQVEVMERIFGSDTAYSETTREQLMQVMLLSEQSNADISIYGKTGMGKVQGIVVDSWYTGFADTADQRIYFCVYLGETDDKNVSSAKAREIAVEIVADYLL